MKKYAIGLPELGFENYLINGNAVPLCWDCARKISEERGEKLVFLGWAAEGVLCSNCRASYDPDAAPAPVKSVLVMQLSILDSHGEAAGVGPGECGLAQMIPVYISTTFDGVLDVFTLMHKSLHLAIRYGYQKGLEVGMEMSLSDGEYELGKAIEEVLAEMESEADKGTGFLFDFFDEEIGD